MPIQPLAEVFLDGSRNAGARCGVAQHAARGAIELGMVELDRHDRRQTLADTIGVKVGIRRCQQLPLPCVRADRSDEPVVQAALVRAASGGPTVGEAPDPPL